MMAMPQGSAWSRIKPQIAPVTERYIQEHADIFWGYLSERWQIRKRRLAGKPRPWTKDPVLDQYSFTNVFREHDRGTQWLLARLQGGDPTVTPYEHRKRKQRLTEPQRMWIIWCVAQYRWPNHYTLFEDHGWIPIKFKEKEWLKKIAATKKKHGQWHTTAHIVLQSNFARSRAENYMFYLKELDKNFGKFYHGIVEANSMQEAHKHVKSFQGFGDFTAQEVLVDLCLLGVIPNQWRDDWAVAGPGAKEGIDLIYPQAHLQGSKGYTDAMKRIQGQQLMAFRRRGLPRPPRLMLHDIEFAACEVAKLIKIQNGTGRGRRYR